MGFYQYTGETATVITLFNTVVSINVLCSIFTILMIVNGLKKRNGYTLLILYMTISQVIYDSQLFLFNFAVDEQGNYVTNVIIVELTLGICFGVATALYALTICLIMAAIVKKRTYYNLEKNLKVINLVIGVISCAQAIPAAFAKNLDKKKTFTAILKLYDSTRISVILLITLILLYTYLDLRSRGEYSTGGKSNPILVMVSRLSLYPVVQVISRMPVEVYQLYYSKPFLTFVHDPVPSPDKLALIYLSTLTLSFGGAGNMLVFFVVQPEARAHLRGKLRTGLVYFGLTGLASKLVDRQEREIYQNRNDGKRVSNIPASKNPEMNAKLQSFYKKNNSLTRESGFEDSFSDIDIDLNARPDFSMDGGLEIAEDDDDASAATASSRRISEVVKDEEGQGGPAGGADPIPGQGRGARLESVDEVQGENYEEMDEEELILRIVTMEDERRSMGIAERPSISSFMTGIELGRTTHSIDTPSAKGSEISTSVNPIIV